jgi:ferritin
MRRLTPEMATLIQAQVINESNNVRLYRAMSEWLKFNGWKGAAKLWLQYSKGEQDHADRLYQYLQNRDWQPLTQALAGQPKEFVSLENIIKQSLSHEIEVSGQINAISEAAFNEPDLPTFTFIQWFVKEQIEEEAKLQEWSQRLQAYKDSGSDLILLDKEMKHAAK